MSEIKYTGGPAFPVNTRPCETTDDFGHQDSETTWQFGGMTLRDYFAAKAMAGFLTTESFSDHYTDGIAAAAYHMADAMLKARGEK